METLNIRYCFLLPDDSEEVFDIKLDKRDLVLSNEPVQQLPDWTELGFCQCPNCPLVCHTHSHCPLAVSLVNLIDRVGRLISFEIIHLTVITNERKIMQETTAQKGISSIMGLLMATSGCPHTAFFRPMARFHLPLASNVETIYRATSMYLLAQYFLKKKGSDPDFSMEGLKWHYQNIEIVNINIAKRLRYVAENDSLKDSVINALTLLDVLAKALDPIFFDDSLDEISGYFNTFFK